ncbi:SRPBCC family protein [Streptomyces sp. NPDC004647]|uniref:SRPBCC family protein n=1 Tax=Streptomyces sp. NPDC004647 TaxID=3154671 RepID=UPI0033BDA892
MSNALGKVKDEIAHNPATDRLKEELQNYLQARAEHAVSGIGHKLGETVSKLGDPRQGGPGGLMGSLAKGGQALAEGKSPGQAAVKAGTSQLKETIKDKVKGVFGKGRGKSGGGKSKSVSIVEDIDVGVPVREAYDQWTQFQEFSTFGKGVVSVEKADDTTSNWKVKVAKSTRSWKANVTEQVPDERITWTTEGAKGTVKGVVTFHSLGDNLTRVLLVLEYFPKGLFEKTGNIWRAQGRRARLDLKLYRKFIMMRGEVTDGWRGEIQDGEVVVDHESALEEEERDERSHDEGEDGAEGSDQLEGAEGGSHDDEGEDPGDEPGDTYEERDEAQDEELEDEPEDLHEDEEELEDAPEEAYEEAGVEEDADRYADEPDEDEPDEDETKAGRPRRTASARR